MYKSHSPYQKVKGLPYILDNAERIIFLDYSLGKPTILILMIFLDDNLNLGVKKKKFIFYHYGQNSYDDMKWQIKILTNNQQAKFGEYNNISFNRI